MMGRPRPLRKRTGIGGIALAVLLGTPLGAAAEDVPAVAPSEAEDPAPSEPESPEPGSYWLLTEFDWGDEREVVHESIQFDPYYQCHGKQAGFCGLTRVSVEGELMLAQFEFREDQLFQLVFHTPNLDLAQTKQHLPRVWQGLIDYITQHQGEPAVATELPDPETLALGSPVRTHFWKAPGLEVRVMVGRRDADLFYVGAFFSDPERSEAREASHAKIAESDANFRTRRTKRATRTSDRAKP